MKKLFHYQTLKENSVMIVFFMILVSFSLTVESFFSISNAFNVLRQVTIYGTIALGVTYVVLCGKLDLSVGSMLSMSTVLVLDLHNKIGPLPAIGITILVALLCGAVNGFLVAYLKLNYFIVTLAMLSILQGLTLIYSGGQNIDVRNQSSWFSVFGRGVWLGIPVPVIIFLILAVILQTILTFTIWGRQVVATGGNATATLYSGIDSRLVIMKSYLLSAFTTAAAAIIMGSRVMGTQNNAGENYELLVLSAIILGGNSLLGGSGSILKTIFGIFILGYIENGLILLGYQYYIQWIISGLLIIAVSWFDIKIKH